MKISAANQVDQDIVNAANQVDQERDTARRAEAERLKQRGNVKYNSEDYTSAIRLYGRAVRLVPDNPTYLLNRAAALIMVERYEDAIRDSMEATRTFQN